MIPVYIEEEDYSPSELSFPTSSTVLNAIDEGKKVVLEVPLNLAG